MTINTMATALPPCLCGMRRLPFMVQKGRKTLQLRAQSCGDKGKSTNIVDANMSILRERIEEEKMRQRLQRQLKQGVGWNYQPYYDVKLTRDARLYLSLEIAGLVVGTLGFTFFTGTVCLCLVSLMVHLGH